MAGIRETAVVAAIAVSAQALSIFIGGSCSGGDRRAGAHRLRLRSGSSWLTNTSVNAEPGRLDQGGPDEFPHFNSGRAGNAL